MLIWCLNNVQDLKKHYENTQEFLNVYLTFNISTRSVGPPAIFVYVGEIGLQLGWFTL